MIIISHRGNIEGPNPELENKVSQIEKAINLGYDVEIDIIYKDNKLYLGHDSPQEEITLKWLDQYKNKLWIHCKTKEALFFLHNKSKDLNYFCHDKDFATLTSKNIIWGYPGEKIKNSIFVLPEWENDDISNALGICTDYPEKYLKENYTLLIQGPIRHKTKEFLKKYKETHKNIVFSTWAGEDLYKLKKEVDLTGIVLIENTPIKNVDIIKYNKKNAYNQIYSCLEGLKVINTKYTIKVRSDEYYENLFPFFKKWNTGKITTNNLFFRKFKHSPYHPSDHIISGETKKLYEMFLAAEAKCDKKGKLEIIKYYNFAKNHFNSKMVYNEYLAPEVLLAISYLLYLNKNINRLNYKNFKEIFKEVFDVVDTKSLGEIYVCKDSKQCRFRDVFSNDIDISKIEDL